MALEIDGTGEARFTGGTQPGAHDRGGRSVLSNETHVVQDRPTGKREADIDQAGNLADGGAQHGRGKALAGGVAHPEGSRQGRRMAFSHNSTMFGCISADGLSLTAEVRVSDGSPSGVSYRHDW